MLSARAAVLLTLREGPGYGSQLVRRIRTASMGSVRLALGSLYPALRQLEADRLVRGWIVIPGRRRGGRARRYYELTERGTRASEAAVRALAALLGRPLSPERDTPASRGRLARLELAAELSEAALELSRRGSRRARRGAA